MTSKVNLEIGFSENLKLLEEFNFLLKRKGSLMRTNYEYTQQCNADPLMYSQDKKDDLLLQIDIFSERMNQLQKEISAASKKLLDDVKTMIA